MNIWYTSDLHFGHRKMVERGFRDFPSVPDMNEALVEGWNEVVGCGDTVWVLGDFALHPLLESLPWGQRLHGRKVLVPGNHDGCWIYGETRYRHRLRQQMLYTRLAGFDMIVDHPEPHRIAGERVALSHFPYTADHTSVARHMEHRPTDVGGWLLHGHLHEMWLQHDKQINVGVDAWGLRPVHIDTIAALIEEGPVDRAPVGPHHPWGIRSRGDCAAGVRDIVIV